MRRPGKNATGLGLISRRALLVGGVQLGAMGTLAGRMRFMQVKEADNYRLLAEENRVNLRILPPSRGLIFDRQGRPLAQNDQNYRIVMVREDAGDVRQVLRRLSALVPLSPQEQEDAYAQVMSRSPFVPVTLKDRLSWEDIARVSVNAPALPGIIPEVGQSRAYPGGPTTAHVVGYVGPVSDYDMTRGYLVGDDDPLLEIPRFQVGKTGIEAREEHLLRGQAGTQRIEVNALGRVMRELGREEGQSGADLTLTIDGPLQSYCLARLDGHSASAVVIDLQDGGLRAIASSPSFDPNLFVRGITSAAYDELIERDVETKLRQRPLASKAVQDGYPPGSTFKMVVALAALEAGLLDPEETIRCNGYIEVADVRFHCWKRSGHGNVDLNDSIKQSCDIFYYEIAQRVGIDLIADMARRLGLGERHDVPLSAVAKGIIPDKAWKAQTRGEAWRIGDTVNAAIGQGYVLSSPLQLAVMCARIATGRHIEPKLIDRINGVRQPSGLGDSLGLNENYLRRIRAAMSDVINHPRGTGRGTRILDDAFRMAGKSGTSQVRRITAEERANGVSRNEDLPWHRRDHALFVSFAPTEAPRYAVAVVVEHGGGGSSTAGPIARDIMLQALSDGDVDISAYPESVRGRVRQQRRRIDDLLAQWALGLDRT